MSVASETGRVGGAAVAGVERVGNGYVSTSEEGEAQVRAARADAVVRAIPTGLAIGGEPVPATDGRSLEVVDPATEAVLAQVADAGVEDAVRAAAVAADALGRWAARPPRHRAEVLRRAFDIMCERETDLALLIVRENGKALPDALAEVRYAAEFFRWFAEEAVRVPGRMTTAPGGDKTIMVTYEPVGVSVLVTPWNFPAAMMARKLAPALAAGCATVVKPAPETPLTALALAAILTEAGADPGVVNVVPTSDSDAVVRALLEGPTVRKLSFTGSTRVGRILLGRAAKRIVSCSMELGGNAPFIVLDDCDMDEAVAGAIVAKLRNGGASCIAGNRFYAARAVAEEFTARLAEAMGSVRVGPGLDDGVAVGPLVKEEERTKVEQLVDRAVSAGASVVTGGVRPQGSGYFYAPTVLGAVDPLAEVVSEEIFGPVAPVVPFDDEEEVVAWANSSESGLASYVYTRDVGRGLRMASRLQTGIVGVNRGLVSDPAAPFGGMKQSGIGREGGEEGLLEFLEEKYTAVSW
ncbi:MAG: NAD-dependent succinate-semialdehyde dehydrogenase [Acidimicrobiales bacterium]